MYQLLQGTLLSVKDEALLRTNNNHDLVILLLDINSKVAFLLYVVMQKWGKFLASLLSTRQTLFNP